MVRPPAVTIRNLLVLGGLGDIEKFCGPVRARNGPKTAKSGFSRSWGPFWARRPPTKFDLRAICGPSKPCLGSHVSLGPGIWPFGGGLGAVSSVGDRLCLLGTQLTKKTHFGRNSAPPGRFWEIFGSLEAGDRCATFVLPPLPMVRPPSAAIRDLLFFRGSGGLREISRARLGPKMEQKCQKVDFPSLGGRSGLDAPRTKLFVC